MGRSLESNYSGQLKDEHFHNPSVPAVLSAKDAGPQDFATGHGTLTNPQVDQKSRMFLKPATLAECEHVARIVDLVNKIVSMVEDNTLSKVGATKLVVSDTPKSPN